MTVMSQVDTSHPFTVEDLEETPNDGRRYELIDGEMLVSPAPGTPHQRVSMLLSTLLQQSCPKHLWVMAAPYGVRPDQRNEVQPDLLVADAKDFTMKCLPKAPLLAVEIISPHSRLVDQELKKAFYERLGVPRFWLVDPDVEGPALTVFALADGKYEQLAHVVGEETYDVDQPFPARVTPTELVEGLRP